MNSTYRHQMLGKCLALGRLPFSCPHAWKFTCPPPHTHSTQPWGNDQLLLKYKIPSSVSQGRTTPRGSLCSRIPCGSNWDWGSAWNHSLLGVSSPSRFCFLSCFLLLASIPSLTHFSWVSFLNELSTLESSALGNPMLKIQPPWKKKNKGAMSYWNFPLKLPNS